MYLISLNKPVMQSFKMFGDLYFLENLLIIIILTIDELW